jgi:GxxExxY protein
METPTYRLSELNRISEGIIGSAMEVHREMGPGLIECIYEWCLMDEMRSRGIAAENQLRLPVSYKGRVLQKELLMDVLVESTVVLELKVLEHVLPVHKAQLLSYLRLTGKPLGLLLNFQVPVMRQGVYRIINDRVKIVDDL